MLFSDQHAPAQSIACERRDYPEWHHGRTRYGVWTLPVDCPQVLARLSRAQQHLGDWLHGDYRRQAHITLFVCGFPAESVHFDDDFPGECLAAQLAALQQLRQQPFTLLIGGLDSFASASFLRVTDPEGRLQRLRTTLATHSREIRQAPYHPHLTVGLYTRAVPRVRVQQRLQDFRACAALPLTVRELHFSTYASTELFGPLRTERRVSLHH
jgi:2'-5' RNA ligase